MPKKKITPRPWKVHKPDLSGKPKERPTIVGPLHIKGNPKEADLELISIAPDMLDSLKELQWRVNMILENAEPEAGEASLAREVSTVLSRIWFQIEELEE